jgi:post-segregation antitoxin (ccd killing protein)
MSWVTVSTKVKKEILEKARKCNINISEVLRKALEQEIARREEEEARKSAEKISKELRLPDEEEAKLIKEDRER